MKFNIIYADPPWTFKTYSAKGKIQTSAENHYQTQSLDWIKNLKVRSIAADDCVLFLWATMPCLPDALEVIKAWSFTYKTCGFTWIKKNKKADSLFWGCGFWTRSNSEIRLIATKEKPQRLSRAVHQVVLSKIEGHSKKPDEVRDRIVKLCGDVPRVELFARQKIDGWSAWGDELNPTIENILIDIYLRGIKRV